MGWLFIDTVQPSGFRLGILDASGKGIVTREGRSHRLLIELSKRCSSSVLRRVSGICVVQGPGSFTSVRTGVLVANLLSRLYGKPLIGVSADQARNLSALSQMLSDEAFTPSALILPIYDAEPNITLPKNVSC